MAAHCVTHSGADTRRADDEGIACSAREGKVCFRHGLTALPAYSLITGNPQAVMLAGKVQVIPVRQQAFPRAPAGMVAMDKHGHRPLDKVIAVIPGDGKHTWPHGRLPFAAGNIKHVGAIRIQRQGDREGLTGIFRAHLVDKADPSLRFTVKAVSAADIRPQIQKTLLLGVEYNSRDVAAAWDGQVAVFIGDAFQRGAPLGMIDQVTVTLSTSGRSLRMAPAAQ